MIKKKLILVFLFSLINNPTANTIGLGLDDRNDSGIKYFNFDIIAISLFKTQPGATLDGYVTLGHFNPNIDIFHNKIIIEPNFGIDFQSGFFGVHPSFGPSLNILNPKQYGYNLNLHFSLIMLVKVGLHYQVLKKEKGKYQSKNYTDINFGLVLPIKEIKEFINKK